MLSPVFYYFSGDLLESPLPEVRTSWTPTTLTNSEWPSAMRKLCHSGIRPLSITTWPWSAWTLHLHSAKPSRLLVCLLLAKWARHSLTSAPPLLVGVPLLHGSVPTCDSCATKSWAASRALCPTPHWSDRWTSAPVDKLTHHARAILVWRLLSKRWIRKRLWLACCPSEVLWAVDHPDQPFTLWSAHTYPGSVWWLELKSASKRILLYVCRHRE